MQLSHNFPGLALFVLALTSASKATPLAAPGENNVTTVHTAEPGPYIVSHDEMLHWLATTDAELTFIGKPLNPLAPRAAQDTTVSYCTNRVGSICGGSCTIYHGGAQCLEAPGAQCVTATNNVALCDGPDCTGRCIELVNCKHRLGHDFCYFPNLESILVPDV